MADKPTKKESASRVVEVAHRMALYYEDREIKKWLRETYGYKKNGHQRLFTAARALLNKADGKSKAENKCSALDIYRQIVQTTDDDDIRIKAQMRIDKILGLEEPQLIHQTGKQSVTVKYVDDDWRNQALPTPPRFDLSQIAENGNGTGHNEPQ